VAKKKPAPFPSTEEILEFIENSTSSVGKREIARAFKLDAQQKMTLKKVLRKLKEEGRVELGRKRFAMPGQLPPVAVVNITGTDTDGELIAAPMTWNEDITPPVIYMNPECPGQAALAPGDRVLARLKKLDDDTYEGNAIRRIGTRAPRILGVYDIVEGKGRIRSTDRKARGEFFVPKADSLDAQPGELVRAEVIPGHRGSMKLAKVLERLESMDSPTSISLIAIHDHGIPIEFTEEAINLAEQAGPVPLGQRDDLREIPLVTIDGADARDFDDAVYAEPDTSPDNDGGWRIIVAIADVAYYVRPGDALDKCATERGNSVYFPDRVVPMLPEALSNGWCSLKPDEERPCLAARMRIDENGELLDHRFVRGLMKSHARLTYEQVQKARDGDPDEATAPLVGTVIDSLYGAYKSLCRARRERGVLELDLPERRIVIGDDGNVQGVEQRERFDSHKLIEEFMISANVAAAQTLEKKRQPCMYRIHDEPSKDKIEALRQFLESLSIPLSKGQVIRASVFNNILNKVRDTPNVHLVNEVILRSQAQAEYNPDNIGHFGLALRRYCHFTSPIRRYADLLVHRALISGLGLGEGGLAESEEDFHRLGETLSGLERRAAGAERSAVDRFCAAFLAEKVGSIFKARINGVTRFGLFVTLEDTGADGLIPIRTLPEDYYIHDEKHHELRGRRTKKTYRLSQPLTVQLIQADPVSGSMIMQTVENETSPPRSEEMKTKRVARRNAVKKSKSKAGRRRARKKDR